MCTTLGGEVDSVFLRLLLPLGLRLLRLVRHSSGHRLVRDLRLAPRERSLALTEDVAPVKTRLARREPLIERRHRPERCGQCSKGPPASEELHPSRHALRLGRRVPWQIGSRTSLHDAPTRSACRGQHTSDWLNDAWSSKSAPCMQAFAESAAVRQRQALSV